MGNQLNESYYQKDEKWASYKGYDNARSRILDYPYYNYSDAVKKIYNYAGCDLSPEN